MEETGDVPRMSPEDHLSTEISRSVGVMLTSISVGHCVIAIIFLRSGCLAHAQEQITAARTKQHQEDTLGHREKRTEKKGIIT